MSLWYIVVRSLLLAIIASFILLCIWKSDTAGHPLSWLQTDHVSAHVKQLGNFCKCKNNSNDNKEDYTTTFKVPNIVHYTWYTLEGRSMRFKQYLGVLSAYKILKPDKIYIHMNVSKVPGPYFRKIKALGLVEAVNDGSPHSLLGKRLVKNDTKFFSDYSDIGRLKYLLTYGGIYLDYDVLVIKSLDKFRRDYDFTLGQEQSKDETFDLLNSGVIISSKDAPFLYLWASGYADDYQPDKWVYNSGHKPTLIWKRFPHLIHVEPTKMNRPNCLQKDLEKIWGNKTFNWRDNYTVHTWFRFRSTVTHYRNLYGYLEPDEADIQTMNNTYAEIARYILSL